ncbi:amino acid ABC transporter substrate-binding protein [Candidatus Dependentiae bacterium]|nr:amino acid ABC transporter substrate-binding protein [Candidatus Dependentiae bacterium]
MKKLVIGMLVAAAAFTVVWYRRTNDYKPLGKVLVAGTSADFPPFSYRDLDNTIVGLDIDIVKELANRLNLTLELKDRPFTTLLPEIELGRIHVIAAGMTPTPERAKNVHFTKSYVTGNPLLVVTLAKNPKLTSLEELKNKTVAVNTGYIADLYMSNIPDITLVRLPKLADAFTALESGKAYALVVSNYSLKPYLKELDKDGNKFNTLRLEETDENYALAVSSKLPASFAQDIEKTLDTMQADGTLDALKQKWEIL